MADLPSLNQHAKAFGFGILLALFGIVGYMQWGPGASANLPSVTVYKSPTCGCCTEWADYMRDEGFEVDVRDEVNLQAVRQKMGVPEDLAGCHTAVVGEYVVEGHVPAEEVKTLLQQTPDLRGISVPGMPVGSPGMEQGDYVEPYSVVGFTPEGETTVVAQYGSQE